ncbi:kinase-like domain-containing protein [Rhizophagus clarus]|uniref:Kinase-like domain-containing protein n=1 Tax=Rhizophagus clarus TaxID=94130 RepID=A0A8H3QRT4_9GLOM|nr:kinase-like domain-containing protein [Rhizophagus clarus]
MKLKTMMEKFILKSKNVNRTDKNKPVNSNDYLSSFQEPISSITANPISECLDCELNELDLNQDDYE